jgi:oxygen-independent coproporphyrinogen-3 oxidase
MMESVAGVYLSYPFCAQKCTYCNFASGVMPKAMEEPYVDSLLREVGAMEFTWTPDTVYLGGGTPSSMDPAQLERILAAIPGKPWREATIETAPGTVTAANTERWVTAGIKRVSLGVQSFVRAELTRTGRRHTAETVHDNVETLWATGITNINLDLIAGLPGQTLASWNESLDWVEKLGAPHVSIYMLEVDEDSRLGKEMLLGGVRYGAGDAPSEDLTAHLYETAVERLARMGIARYEISNFARPGFESIHNLKYWRRQPYLGFGADAHSFDHGRRWQNTESMEDYIRSSPNARVEETDANASEEKFFVGLRLMEGIAATHEDFARHGQAIKRFVRHGLMEQNGSRLRLTPRGVMVSNDVFQEFLKA